MLYYLFFFLLLQYPYIFRDPDNFIITPANPIVTPTHIQHEWYFLFAYVILRFIPNKLGEVIVLTISILILYTFLLTKSIYSHPSSIILSNQLIFWIFINTFNLLTWVGAQLIEDPYILISQILTITYFLFFVPKLWKFIIYLLLLQISFIIIINLLFIKLFINLLFLILYVSPH